MSLYGIKCVESGFIHRYQISVKAKLRTVSCVGYQVFSGKPKSHILCYIYDTYHTYIRTYMYTYILTYIWTLFKANAQNIWYMIPRNEWEWAHTYLVLLIALRLMLYEFSVIHIIMQYQGWKPRLKMWKAPIRRPMSNKLSFLYQYFSAAL